MNRQAKRFDFDPWEDFGAVTHAEAARQYAMMFGDVRQIRVITRDEESPSEEFFHDVTPELVWHVRSLRGEDD